MITRVLGLCAVIGLLIVGCAHEEDPLTPKPTHLYGIVVDARSDVPVAGATLSAGGVSTQTDLTGQYRLLDIPSGQQTFSVTAPNYHAWSTSMLLTGGSIQKDIALHYGPPQIGNLRGTYSVTQIGPGDFTLVWDMTVTVVDFVAVDSVWTKDWDGGVVWGMSRQAGTSDFHAGFEQSSVLSTGVELPDSIYARDHDGFLTAVGVAFH
jgi:hypothetical protein